MHFRLEAGNQIVIVRIIIALSLAMLGTVWSVFLLHLGLSEAQIGLYSSFVMFLAVSASFIVPFLLQRFRKGILVLWCVFIPALLYFLVGAYQSFLIFAIATSLAAVLQVIRVNAFDILMHDATSKQTYSQLQGLHYSLLNVMWLTGPLLTGFFLAHYSYDVVFYVIGGLFLLAAFIFIFFHIKEHLHQFTNIRFPVISYLKDTRQRLPYLLSFGTHSWWSLGEIYFPIFLITSGAGVQYVAIFMALWCVPPIIMEYPIGRLAKKIPLKHFFRIGFFGLFVIAVSCFFIDNIWIIFWLLILSGAFASLIEPLNEPFFFARTKSKDEANFLPFFITSKFLGPAISRGVTGLVLLVLVNQYAYLVFALICLLCFIGALFVKR
ncbi:MAG: MFS transporter [Candidatus Woesearchaeota archaeon]